MLAKRLPLLLAFAAGSIGTALAGFGHGETEPNAAPQPRRALESASTSQTPLSTTSNVAAATPPSEPANVHAPTNDDDARTEGNSVADVLMRLEQSYRQALVAPVSTPAPQEEQTVAPAPVAPAPVASAPATVPAVVPAAQVSPAPPVSPPRAEPPAPEPQAPAEPVRVAENDTSPSDVHIGDVHQNIYLGNVHQGDLLQLHQMQQVQQLSVIQYLQLLALSQSGATAPARAHEARRPAPRRPRPFSMPLTNPDNPWGFDHPPTVLVK